VSIVSALPAAALLALKSFPPLTTVLIGGAACAIWAALSATLWGVGPGTWLSSIAEHDAHGGVDLLAPSRSGGAGGPGGESTAPAGQRLTATVVIACYNAERTIAETIESILAQTRPPESIVIADDCSTDSSREIIARYPAVRLIVQPDNRGAAAARNAAIAVGRTDVVAIIDADDLWYPDHLANALEMLERFPEAGFVFAANDRFGRFHDTVTPEIPAGRPLPVLDWLLPGNQVALLTVVFRRELYDECGGFDGEMRYCEDYDLWLRFALRTYGVYTGIVSAAYRVHAGQLNQHMPQMFAGTWHARLKLLDSVRRDRPEEALALQQRLGEIWASGLYTAWAVRSRDSLEFMLAIRDRFPEQRAAERRWRLGRLVWPLLLHVDRFSRWLPVGIRSALRPKWMTPTTTIPRL
jgi:glycosyltransferase involved in cell wall biosynthesis